MQSDRSNSDATGRSECAINFPECTTVLETLYAPDTVMLNHTNSASADLYLKRLTTWFRTAVFNLFCTATHYSSNLQPNKPHL